MTENNNINHDELQELFAQFNPEIPDANDFVRKLESRLAAIEDVKDRNRVHYARLKKAVGIAIFFGFLIGMALTLSFPMIMSGIKALLNSIAPAVGDAAAPISWIVISLGTILSAVTAYDLSLSPAVQSKLK